MAKKVIVWSEIAKLQFANVLEYYVERNGNPNYSLKLLNEVEDLLNTLSNSELIGRLTSNKFTLCNFHESLSYFLRDKWK